MRSLRFIAPLLPLIALPLAMSAQNPAPPIAKRLPVELVLHGERRVDDYAYFKDRKHPETIPYLEAENRYTDAMMAHTAALQQQLYEEMLAKIKEDDAQVPERHDGWFYYSRTEKGKPYPIYARKRGALTAREEIYFDQNAEAEGHAFYSLGGMEVSPDHNLLAVLVDTTGYEDFILRIKDLRTGTWLPDEITQLSWGLAWANDNTTLFYMTPDSAKRGDAVWRHRLGTPRSADVKVYQDTDVLFNVGVSRARNGAFILISSGSFTSSEWHLIPTDRPTEAPRVVAPRRPGVEYEVEPGEGVLYIVTNEGAQNFRVMTAPVATPERAQWRDWLAPRADVFVEGVMPFKHHVVVVERCDGLRRLRIASLDGKRDLHEVTFPEAAYGVFPGENPQYEARELRFSYSSLVTPSTVFDYDMDRRTRIEQKRTEVPGYDPSRYEVERLYATARDGTRIPISLVHRKGFVRDGKAPLLLYAYGSYGSTTEPTFSSQRFALVDRGFTYAIAHVRGGQEMGRPWYDDGKMLKKQNTFTDFIDVAD
ncbi:MAG: hypothetical protein RL625_303, partial [Gemmatimonadota bacterium]